jgi:4'-phosphopantetheinyl transferase
MDVCTSATPRLSLDASRVDLWCTFCDEIGDERLLAEYRRLLTEEERVRQQRFHFPIDRHRYLLTRVLVRTALSNYATIGYRSWEFAASAHGRPYVANHQPGARKIVFNLSHTLGLIVLAVTHEREVGVDVENMCAREPALELADKFFAPAEAAALRQMPAELRQQRFFHYWTLKESYSKARGLGLSIPLQEFSFSFPADGRVSLHVHAPGADDPARWQFWQLQIAAKYVSALCLERRPAPCPQPRLSIRRVVPLESEEPLSPTLLRVSN